MPYEIDGSQLYYFLCQFDDKYYTLFVGFMRPELFQAFTELEEGGQAHLRIKIGEHTFISALDCPLYALEYGKDGALEFAGDDGKLTLSPNGTQVNLDLSAVIDFPTYWTADIEPMLDFKLGCGIYVNDSGQWVELTF